MSSWQRFLHFIMCHMSYKEVLNCVQNDYSFRSFQRQVKLGCSLKRFLQFPWNASGYGGDSVLSLHWIKTLSRKKRIIGILPLMQWRGLKAGRAGQRIKPFVTIQYSGSFHSIAALPLYCNVVLHHFAKRLRLCVGWKAPKENNC